MNDVERALVSILAGGPMSSREVLAEMAAAGNTVKQVRRARERLGITIGRSGSGASMRSTWALPAEVLDAAAEPGTAPRPLLHTPRAQTASEALAPGGLLASEQTRVARRIAVFALRGLDKTAAAAVATILVMERDRPGIRAVSCVECQCYTAPGSCAAAAFTAGPRDPRQVWACGWARNDAP